MGLAGNVDPAFVEPTVVGYPQGAAGGRAPSSPLADLDYVIGSAALSPAYAVSYPMKQGLITDWDSMEKLWASCFYKCVKGQNCFWLPGQSISAIRLSVKPV